MRVSGLWIAVSALCALVTNTNAQSAAEIQENVSWCVWHEGVRLYADGAGKMRPMSCIREDCVRAQRRNPEVQRLIASLGDKPLKRFLKMARNEIYEEYEVQTNLRWVMFHKGQADVFVKLANSGKCRDIRELRRIYARAQNHNPHAMNLLAGLSDQDIRRLVHDA